MPRSSRYNGVQQPMDQLNDIEQAKKSSTFRTRIQQAQDVGHVNGSRC